MTDTTESDDEEFLRARLCPVTDGDIVEFVRRVRAHIRDGVDNFFAQEMALAEICRDSELVRRVYRI